MVGAESGWIRKYCAESLLLAEVLKTAHEPLYYELIETIEKLKGTIE